MTGNQGFFGSVAEAAKLMKAGALQLTYLGGHPDLAHQSQALVSADGDCLRVFSLAGAGRSISIRREDILGLSLVPASTATLGRTAAGALAGAALAGGFGLLAGAALGGRARDASLIRLILKRGPLTVEVFFGGKDAAKQYAAFAGLLATPSAEPESPAAAIPERSAFLAEMDRLAERRRAGEISADEFADAKRALIESAKAEQAGEGK